MDVIEHRDCESDDGQHVGNLARTHASPTRLVSTSVFAGVLSATWWARAASEVSNGVDRGRLSNHGEASVLITVFGVESCSPCVTVAAPEE